MTDKPLELSIEVTAQTMREIERAAAERGMTAPAFLEDALRRYLIDTSYIDEEATAH